MTFLLPPALHLPFSFLLPQIFKRSSMEAPSFLASKTFNNGLNFIPSLTKRPSKWLQGSSSSPSSSTIPAACNLRSRLSEDDDDGRQEPAIKSDWRSYRARLVAGELAPSAAETVTAQRPVLGDRWGHCLPEPEKGCLLVATEKLDGVHIFERTVILLTSAASPCPSGVILNRPSLMSIKEVKPSSFKACGAFSDRPLLFGGPLEGGLFLVRSGKGGEWGALEEVMEGLWCGTRESVGCGAEMVRRKMAAAEDFRFFDGYCGWEKEQLKGEIRAGYWKVVACSLSVVERSSAGMWEEVSGLVGGRNLWGGLW